MRFLLAPLMGCCLKQVLFAFYLEGLIGNATIQGAASRVRVGFHGISGSRQGF
jgi:hypothetical protein